MHTRELFDAPPSDTRSERLAPGAWLLHGFAHDVARALLAAVDAIESAAPFRHLTTPGGFRMSVAMTNCGRVGWITDRRGYCYQSRDPESGRPWPAMPALLLDVAVRAAAAGGFNGFVPDSCLINRYGPDARLTLHQDRNENDFAAPIVSVSLGLPAVFLWGGLRRGDRPRRLRLESGDVVVWGGPSRLTFHGIDALAEGEHALTGRCRINLTFRNAL